MQIFTLAAVAIFAGLANAQVTCVTEALSVPPCATTCIESVANSAGCGDLDFACQCSNSALISSLCASSVVSQCGGVTSALQAQSAANAVCSCVTSAEGSPATAAARVTARAF